MGGSDFAISGAVESEKGVLGVVLNEPDKLPQVIERLGDGACLSDSCNEQIYRTMLRLHAGGRKADLRTVIDEMRTAQLVPSESNTEYLWRMATGCDSCLIRQHCSQIIEAHQRRSLYLAMSRTITDLQQGEAVAEVLASLSEELQRTSAAFAVSAGLETKTVGEILTSTEEPEWLIRDLLPQGRIGIMSGEVGLGKTWFMLALALAVAQGTPLFGRFQTTQGPVLIVDEESGSGLLAKRLRKLGVGPNDNLPLHVACFSRLQLDKPEGQARLRAAIRKHSAKLVIVDSLVRVHTLDENDASQMKLLTTALVDIAREEHCAIVLTAHARKKAPNTAESGQSMRGSTEVAASADMHLHATKLGDGDMRIAHEKARYGPAVPAFVVTLQDSPDGRLSMATEDEAESKVSKAKSVIVGMLRAAGGPVLRTVLESAYVADGGKPKTFCDALRSLVREGRLIEESLDGTTKTGKPRKMKGFRLSEEGDSRD